MGGVHAKAIAISDCAFSRIVQRRRITAFSHSVVTDLGDIAGTLQRSNAAQFTFTGVASGVTRKDPVVVRGSGHQVHVGTPVTSSGVASSPVNSAVVGS